MATGRLPDPNTAPLTAKGDLYTYSTVPARLAVGNNGETLVADSSATTGLRWQEPKSENVILNSSFDVWQRGTSFTGVSPYYTADRWVGVRLGAAAGGTWSRQTASLTGFNYSMRVQRNSGNSSTNTLYLGYSLESADSFALAGKTVVLSFWAKAGANYSPTSSAMKTEIATGTGTDQQKYVAGFTGDSTTTGTHTLTTSWQRFSATATLSSSATEVAIGFYMEPTGTASTNDWFEVTGVQLEVGSVATPYRRYSATLAGELAACQRYYWRNSGDAQYSLLVAAGFMASTTSASLNVQNPVPMRTTAASVDYANVLVQDASSVNYVPSAAAIEAATNTKFGCAVAFTVTGGTTGRFVRLLSNNTTSGYIGISAEL